MTTSPDTDFTERLRRVIGRGGPMPLSHFIAACNAHYYGSRDPLGVDGDFITAPEISQMFGELIGLWAADLALRADARDFAWVELGPGRGTLSRDALAAMAQIGLAPEVHLVETSPVLSETQAQLLPDAIGHEAVDTLPTDRPLIIIANEFFDALPVRQLTMTRDGWREMHVLLDHRSFKRHADGPRIDAELPASLARAPVGSIWEVSPASAEIMTRLAGKIAAQGGAMLVVDYGYSGPALGDTLQAVKDHAFADVFADAGQQDLTTHVDFAALAKAAGDAGLTVHGLTGQGAFLEMLGIGPRAAALAQAQPERSADIETARNRLTASHEMGELFKVMAFTARAWPVPEGFA